MVSFPCCFCVLHFRRTTKGFRSPNVNTNKPYGFIPIFDLLGGAKGDVVFNHPRHPFGAFCLDVRTLTFCQRIWVFRIKPPKVKLLAGVHRFRNRDPTFSGAASAFLLEVIMYYFIANRCADNFEVEEPKFIGKNGSWVRLLAMGAMGRE